MADFSLTQLNATIQELWDQKVEEARYAEGVIVNRVSNKSEIAKKKGDRIHVSIDQKYTTPAVGSDGTFTPQTYTLTTSTILLDQWRAVPIQILDQAASQSFWTPDSTFPTNAGKAFANQYDADLAGLWSSVAAGNTLGSTADPQPFSKGSAQEALFRMADTNIPLTNLSFILHPVSYYGGLLNEAQLTKANEAGQGKNVLTTGFIFPLLGVPVYTSTNIVETGSPVVKKNLLLHKSAMAIAWSKSNVVERARATANLTLADLYVMQSVYGFLVVRSDHFVVINTSKLGSFT